MLAIELADHRRAVAVTDEDGALDAGVREHRVDCPREQLDRVLAARLGALAVSRKIDGDQAAAFAQRGHLTAKERMVAGPAMHEDDRLFNGAAAAAGVDVVDR